MRDQSVVSNGGAPVYKITEAERAMLRGTWPMELIDDPARHPRIIDTAENFLREVLIGEHLEDFLILPNGVELLDLGCCSSLPTDLQNNLRACKSAHDFIVRIQHEPTMLERYRADIEYVDSRRQQRDVLRKEKRELGKRIEEALRVVKENDVDPALLYVAEMRLRNEAAHPVGGEKVKTVCQRDVKDVLGPYIAWTLYWDRYDEGFFAGGRRSGKGVHVDQVLWSNVGRNWQGYKLVAAWPKGEISKQVAGNFYDVLYYPPLQERELNALRQAAKIALIRPGDVYLFSGGVAHTVLCVSEEMCLGAYESLVSLHPAHVEHFLHTDDTEGPYCLDKYSMCSKELKETKNDCIDLLEDAADQLQAGGVRAASYSAQGVSATWDKLIAHLHADSHLQATLRKFYALAVQRCHADRHFRRHMPQSVLEAAQTCFGDTCTSLPGRLLLGHEEHHHKRRRCHPKSEDKLPPHALQNLPSNGIDQQSRSTTHGSRSCSQSSDMTSSESP